MKDIQYDIQHQLSNLTNEHIQAYLDTIHITSHSEFKFKTILNQDSYCDDSNFKWTELNPHLDLYVYFNVNLDRFVICYNKETMTVFPYFYYKEAMQVIGVNQTYFDILKSHSI